MNSFSSLVRADNWAYSKIPPLLAVGYGTILVNGMDFLSGLQALFLSFVCIFSVAAYGHIVNDIFDIEQDLAIGKKNAMARLSPILRLGACLIFIASGVGPLFLRDFGLAAVILLAINYLLPMIYSVPFIRLKERGFLGVLADALGAHLVPTLFIALSLTDMNNTSSTLGYAVAASAGIWAFFAGLRGIIIHQIADERSDRSANVVTFVTSRRRKRLRKLVLRFFVPCEVIGLIWFLGIMLPSSPLLAIFILIYGAGEFAKVKFRWKLPLFYPEHPSKEPYLPLVNNEFHEVWLPCALVGQLVFKDLFYGLMLAVHIVLFRSIIKERLIILGNLRHDFSELRRRGRIARIHKKGFKVIVGATYWALNGVNVFSVNLVRGLRAKGIDAHILLTEESSVLIHVNDARMEQPDDIPFERLPVERRRSWGGHWGAMVRYLEDNAPCVYIPNSDWRHSCVSPLLSDNVGLIGVVHSDDPLHYDHVKRLGRYWNAIATTSHTIARKTLDLDASLRERLQVIPIGVDIPATPPNPRVDSAERLKVIYPGTLKQHQKRVLDLPKVIAAAVARNVPVSLTIAGGGPDEERLKAACQELVDQGVIKFLGVVNHDRVLDLLEAHDVFILTSEFEGMPNALLEAMGRGCVPLVTDMESAVPELVRNGESGYVVPIGDIDAFAERLEQLRSD